MSHYDVKFIQNKDPLFNMWMVADDPHDDEHNMNYDEYLTYMNFGVKRVISTNGLDTQNYRYYEIVEEKQYFLSKIKYGF
jgi:hypothetical protein